MPTLRSAALRIAAELPEGSPTRRKLLTALRNAGFDEYLLPRKNEPGQDVPPFSKWDKITSPSALPGKRYDLQAWSWRPYPQMAPRFRHRFNIWQTDADGLWHAEWHDFRDSFRKTDLAQGVRSSKEAHRAVVKKMASLRR
jgi:hypothetical protein